MNTIISKIVGLFRPTITNNKVDVYYCSYGQYVEESSLVFLGLNPPNPLTQYTQDYRDFKTLTNVEINKRILGKNNDEVFERPNIIIDDLEEFIELIPDGAVQGGTKWERLIIEHKENYENKKETHLEKIRESLSFIEQMELNKTDYIEKFGYHTYQCRNNLCKYHMFKDYLLSPLSTKTDDTGKLFVLLGSSITGIGLGYSCYGVFTSRRLAIEWLMIIMLQKKYSGEFSLYRNDTPNVNEFNNVNHSLNIKNLVENENFDYGDDFFYSNLAEKFRNNQNYIYF